MQAVVLAAGKGTRMRSKLPKVLQKLLGKPMLHYVLDTLKQVGVKNPIIVVGSGSKQVCSFLKDYEKSNKGFRARVVLQSQQKGTGHAVMMAKKSIRPQGGDVLIWPADMPLLKAATIRKFQKTHQAERAIASVLSSIHQNPIGYGRVLRYSDDEFYAIREELDASDEERQVQEINTGVYLFKPQELLKSLGEIKPQNKKKEYYLTDTIEILSEKDFALKAFPFAEETEGLGINSREHLSDATKVLCARASSEHQANGVSITFPDQTVIEPGVRIGQDTIIHPWTYIESGVVIEEGCEIGPFAKIRSGSRIGSGTVIGSFVEICRAKVGKNVIAKHLTYLGDAAIGDGVNVGAGTITANFDGKKKHVTKIGKNVLIGSNTVFVAPANVGDGAKTGAGSVVTKGTRIKKGEVVAGIPAKALKKKK